MIYLALFWCYFKIGLLGFGGGYAAIALIQSQVVVKHQWLTITEFTDIISISQMTPGPIGINCATFVGLRIAGIPGAIVSTFSYVLPSIIILMLLAYFYFKYRNFSIVQSILGGLRPAVVALIASAGGSIIITAFWSAETTSYLLSNINVVAVLLFIGAFLILRKTKCNPMYIMIGCGVVGAVLYGLQ